MKSVDPVGSSSALRRRGRAKKRNKYSLLDESSILDDIIIEILSRLPIKDVLRYQCVSKRWRNLTSTRDFIELHIKRSFPMIFKPYLGRRILLDRCWEPTQTRLKIHETYDPKGSDNSLMALIGDFSSHNGLIVSYGGMRTGDLSQNGFIIYNPIYHDSVHIITSEKKRECVMYGVFFHPLQNEYCTIWRITLLDLPPMKFQFRILNLESNPTWRDIKNPCTQSDRIFSDAVLVDNKYFYWMVEPFIHFKQRGFDFDNSAFKCDIMEYDIAKEEFRMLPCPVSVNVFRHSHYNVNLVNIGGAISLVEVLPSKELSRINIWTLKNGWEKLWTSSNYTLSSDVCPRYGFPKPIAFRNGELVLRSDGRLYVCNLKLGTFKKLGKKHNNAAGVVMSHVTSLVSIRNCKSKIYMEEEDENNQIESGHGDEIQALG